MHWVETKRTDVRPSQSGRQSERHPERQFERSRLFGAGILVEDGGPGRFNCLIRDISPHGAQIRIKASQLVPASSYLINLRSGWAHHAQPVWRKGSLAGLRLNEAHALAVLPAHLEYLNAAR